MLCLKNINIIMKGSIPIKENDLEKVEYRTLALDSLKIICIMKMIEKNIAHGV